MKVAAVLTMLFLAMGAALNGNAGMPAAATAFQEEGARLVVSCGMPGAGHLDRNQRTPVQEEGDIAAFRDALEQLRPEWTQWPREDDPLLQGIGTRQGQTPAESFFEDVLQQGVQYSLLLSNGGETALYMLAHDRFTGTPILLTGDPERTDEDAGTAASAEQFTMENVAFCAGGNVETLFALTERFLAAYPPETLYYPGETAIVPLVFHSESGTCAYPASGQAPPPQCREMLAALNGLNPAGGEIGPRRGGIDRIVCQGDTGLYVDSLDRFSYELHEGGIRTSRAQDGRIFPARQDRVDRQAYERLLTAAREYYEKCPRYAAVFFDGLSEAVGSVNASACVAVSHGEESWHVWYAAGSLVFLPVEPDSRRILEDGVSLPGAYRFRFMIDEAPFTVDVTETEMAIHTGGRAEAFRFADREAVKAFLQKTETDRAEERRSGEKYPANPPDTLFPRFV